MAIRKKKLTNADNLTGDVTGIWGNAGNITGACGISLGKVLDIPTGNVSAITGDVSEIYNDVSRIRGDGRKILNVDTLLGEGGLSLSVVKHRNMCR